MSVTATLRLTDPLDPEVVERMAVERGEPDWLRASRRAAVERDAAWPTGQEEEWRRFPPREIPASPLIGAAALTRYEAAGAYAADLATAARARPELVLAHIDRGGQVATHAAFTRLADAFWSEGSFVHVPRGMRTDRPVVIERRWAAGDAACLSRTVVVAEEGSSVTVVEDVTSDPGGKRAAVPHVELHAGPGAEVRYILVQQHAEGVWDIGAHWYGSAAHSRLESYNVLLGSSRTKLGVVSDILGDAAEVKLHGVIAAGDQQRIDVNSLQRLDGRGSQSDLLYLSALYGSAKATFYGLTRVEKTSHASGSYQECRNLLLSDKAGAHPIPVLEILTNDVARCGHGATAGRLSEEEVFYLMSRGIGRRDAEQVLVRGSFSRVIDRIPDAGIRTRILEALAPRIGRVAELELAA